VAQHVQVIDRVGASGHPRDQAAHLEAGAGAARTADGQVLAGQGEQAGPLGQANDRTSPARGTRFGSSNRAEIFNGSCDNRT
jgi:hypothetical protein